jgi:hypothetical protein
MQLLVSIILIFSNMIKKIIICLFCIILFSCTQKPSNHNNIYTLEPTDEKINIKLESKEKNLSFCTEYFSSKDSNYIAILNEKYNRIDVFNTLASKLVKSIEIKMEGNNSFFSVIGFTIKNLDTVLAVSLVPQFIGVINGRGEVLKKIPYEKDISGSKNEPSFAEYGGRPILVNNTLYLSQGYRAVESKGLLTATKHKYTNVSIAIDIKTGECKRLPLTYPSGLIGKDISGMNVSRVLGFNNSFIYHFGIFDSLYVTNDHLKFKYVKLESNYKFKFPEDNYKYMADMERGMKYLLSRDEVQDFYYDRYRKCYYLVVRQRNEDLGKSPDFRTKFVYPHCFIVILDNNLNNMGEVFFPDDTYSFKMMFITENGLYISEDHVNNPSFNEDAMRFRLFKLKKI